MLAICWAWDLPLSVVCIYLVRLLEKTCFQEEDFTEITLKYVLNFKPVFSSELIIYQITSYYLANYKANYLSENDMNSWVYWLTSIFPALEKLR